MNDTTYLLPAGRTLGIIGSGVMGKTLLKGILDAGLVSRRQVWATAKSQASCEEVAETLQVDAVRDYHEAAREAGVLVICVKPAQIGAVAATLREAGVRQDTPLISLLARGSTH